MKKYCEPNLENLLNYTQLTIYIYIIYQTFGGICILPVNQSFFLHPQQKCGPNVRVTSSEYCCHNILKVSEKHKVIKI